MTAQPTITLTQIQKFFSTPERPVSITEFKVYWESLSDEEKEYVRKQVAELSA